MISTPSQTQCFRSCNFSQLVSPTLGIPCIEWHMESSRSSSSPGLGARSSSHPHWPSQPLLCWTGQPNSWSRLNCGPLSHQTSFPPLKDLSLAAANFFGSLSHWSYYQFSSFYASRFPAISAASFLHFSHWHSLFRLSFRHSFTPNAVRRLERFKCPFVVWR